MAAKFDNMAQAVERGRVAPLTRLDKGIPRTLQLLPLLRANSQGVPVWFLVLKAAWESAGNVDAISASGKDVGLFQLIIKPGETLKGYTYEQVKDPAINTRIFASRVNAWRDRLFANRRGWFPEGRDSTSVWGIIWLFGAIGSHATRYLMDVIGPGANTFGRIVDFAATMPNWFSGGDQKTHWGVQPPELVVFRILISERVMQRGASLRARLGDVSGVPGTLLAKAGSGVVPVVGLLCLGVAAGIVGYYSYRDRQRYQQGWAQLRARFRRS